VRPITEQAARPHADAERGREQGGGAVMINAYVLIEAEPTRVQELIQELPGMELEGSVIKQVHAVTGRYDLIAYVESPDLQSLGN